MSVEGDPLRANGRAAPKNLTSLVRRVSLVSGAHHTLVVYPTNTPFHPEFLKPPSPVLYGKTSLKPLTTMPGSLFPRSPSMFPDFAPVLQTPRIQRATNGALPPTLEQPDHIEAEVRQILEDRYAEADISSGAFPATKTRTTLTLTCRRRGSTPA